MNQSLNQTAQHFRDLSLQYIEPVYKLNVERIKEVNLLKITPSNGEQSQPPNLHFLTPGLISPPSMSKQHRVVVIQQASEELSRQLSAQSIRVRSQRELQVFTSNSGSNSSKSAGGSSMHGPLSSIPSQIQSKHQIARLLNRIEENNRMIDDYKSE